jgi:hypothetical protein
MTTTSSTTFDFDTLRRAIEERDAETIAGLYAPDAEVRLIDDDHPPSAPRILRGVEEIAAHHRDVCSRDMTHRVSHETLAGDRAAFSVECRYPDGKGVLCMGILELRDGLIAGEIGVQAWDR